MASLANKAKVIAARFITPSVRWFQLQSLGAQSDSHRFYAGQWLDLYIPGSDVVGGYSMCSSPLEFENSGRFDLAVKLSDHTAATWMHKQCSVGMELSYKFGGDVYLDDTDLALKTHCFLLVAGGVGINPIYSILQTVLSKSSQPVCLLYSAQTKAELMFSEDICQMAEEFPKLTINVFLTREAHSETLPREAHSETLTREAHSETLTREAHSETLTREAHSETLPNKQTILGRHISEGDIEDALQKLSIDKLEAYICGPDQMITSIDLCLQRHGVAANQIHYERWS